MPLPSFHFSPMKSINGTNHGMRSSSRVAMKKSIIDRIKLPQSPSQHAPPSSPNNIWKSSRIAEASSLVVESHSATNAPSPTTNTPPSPPNNIRKSSRIAEASSSAAQPYSATQSPTTNTPPSLPNNDPKSSCIAEASSSVAQPYSATQLRLSRV